MKSQYERLERLLTRKTGATAMDIVREVGTVCPHRRMADLRAKGWAIVRKEIPGKNYGRYFGVKPQ